VTTLGKQWSKIALRTLWTARKTLQWSRLFLRQIVLRIHSSWDQLLMVFVLPTLNSMVSLFFIGQNFWMRNWCFIM